MQYQEARFIGADGLAYDLAPEVAQHLMELVLAEQREHQKETGKQAPVARRNNRPERASIVRRERPAPTKE